MTEKLDPIAEKKKYKHLRKLRNIRFMPGSKLRLVFGAMTAGMFFSALLLWNVMSLVRHSLAQVQASDPASVNLVEEIRDAISNVLAAGIFCNLASGIVALIFGLMVSHRFYGPVVPLKRHMKKLEDGDYSARVHLRPGDELLELMDQQNNLAEKLEAKFGPSKR